MALDGLFAMMKIQLRPRLLGPYGTFDTVADTEFYLFSPQGLVYHGWLLRDDMPPLEFDFEEALRQRPGAVGRYALQSDGRYRIDWADGSEPTVFTLPDPQKVRIKNDVYALMSHRDRLEYGKSKRTR